VCQIIFNINKLIIAGGYAIIYHLHHKLLSVNLFYIIKFEISDPLDLVGFFIMGFELILRPGERILDLLAASHPPIDGAVESEIYSLFLLVFIASRLFF
jgi:hypothetical protein